MTRTLVHRGPDDEGYFVDEHVALGHRRLSIIDLETGRQPLDNEDGSVWIVFNGEIYNYRDLRALLETKGHTFKTRIDTETIVHAYEEWGAGCLERLRGMFAFALWDRRRRQLLLARDRLGKKPLYYATVGDRLIFASEIKALLAFPGLDRDLDLEAVSDYLLAALHPAREDDLPAGPQAAARALSEVGDDGDVSCAATGTCASRPSRRAKRAPPSGSRSCSTSRWRSGCRATCRSARSSAAASIPRPWSG